jgi:hypothetical protein
MLGKYISAVLETWEGKMSGIVSLGLTLLATYSTFFSGNEGVGRVKEYLWIAAGLTFLFANYMAWRREHQKVASSAPNIFMALEQINWELGEGGNNTVLIFAVYLLNSGAPSITRSWHGTLKIGNGGEENLSLIHISTPWVIANGDQSVTIHPEDSIVAKTIQTRLETGEARTGRVFYTIPGDRISQLGSANFRATVAFLDFTGKVVKQNFIPHGAPLVGVKLFPGEKGSIIPKQPEAASYTQPPPSQEGE